MWLSGGIKLHSKISPQAGKPSGTSATENRIDCACDRIEKENWEKQERESEMLLFLAHVLVMGKIEGEIGQNS